MSRFESTEEFFAAQDAFRRDVRDRINPIRREHGLEEISDVAARECFRLLDEKWFPYPRE